MVIILYFRSEMGSKSTCESSLVVVEAERRQSLPLCAYRQTRYHHVYTTLSSYISVTVTRRDLGIHRGHLEPLPPRLHDLVQLHQCQDHQTWPWDTQRSPWTTTTTFTRPCPVTSVSRSSDVTLGHTEVTLNHYHHVHTTLSSYITVSRSPDVTLRYTEVTLNYNHHVHTTSSSYISVKVTRRDLETHRDHPEPLPPRPHDLVQLHQCQGHKTWPSDTQRSPWTTTIPPRLYDLLQLHQCQGYQTWTWDTQRSPWTTTTTSTRPCPATSVFMSSDVTPGETKVA